MRSVRRSSATLLGRLALCLLLTLHGPAMASPTEFRMITLQYRFAQDVLPVIAPMVEPEGKVSALDNHLMITATPEQMAAIEAVLARLDVARRTWRITVSQDGALDSETLAAGAQGHVRIGDASIGIGEQGRPGRSPGGDGDVTVDLDQHLRRQNAQLVQFLSVADGEQAYIRVGQSVPYAQQWRMLTQRHGLARHATQFHEISTGFVVRPRAIGAQVELQIAPRIAEQGAGGVVDFQALQTTVQVSPGQWFDLGGTMQAHDEVSRSILHQEISEGESRRRIMLRID